MPSLLDVIKKAGVDAVNANNPVNVLYGEVVSINPLSVNIEQRLTLTADFLIVPESLTRYEIDITHGHQYQDNNGSGSTTRTTQPALAPIVIRTGLQPGDKVILLRMQGGQDYLILDKVVEG
ncbi:hypothetical protein OXPF_06080 [Oxobacter pfennigii]|uniref:DUF2577 domain-containing protein n=1 Tax=Oxobacter pfennigii TaxID=36849 RepID=A0A0P8X4W3_9CLOT|nr:DUF2577 domain-containing protein [Oxobacter pfennigii]KPU45819.1 hypothetical protein OXPF_06080 [Oxobacter pfennigii]